MGVRDRNRAWIRLVVVEGLTRHLPPSRLNPAAAGHLRVDGGEHPAQLGAQVHCRSFGYSILHAYMCSLVPPHTCTAAPPTLLSLAPPSLPPHHSRLAVEGLDVPGHRGRRLRVHAPGADGPRLHHAGHAGHHGALGRCWLHRNVERRSKGQGGWRCIQRHLPHPTTITLASPLACPCQPSAPPSLSFLHTDSVPDHAAQGGPGRLLINRPHHGNRCALGSSPPPALAHRHQRLMPAPLFSACRLPPPPPLKRGSLPMLFASQ